MSCILFVTDFGTERVLDLSQPLHSQIVSRSIGKRPALCLRYDEPNPMAGFIRIYPKGLRWLFLRLLAHRVLSFFRSSHVNGGEQDTLPYAAAFWVTLSIPPSISCMSLSEVPLSVGPPWFLGPTGVYTAVVISISAAVCAWLTDVGWNRSCDAVGYQS